MAENHHKSSPYDLCTILQSIWALDEKKTEIYVIVNYFIFASGLQ